MQRRTSLQQHSSVAARQQPARHVSRLTPDYTRQPSRPLPPSHRQRQSSRHHWSLKRRAVASVLVVVALGLGLGTWYGARLLSNVNKVFHANVFTDAHALFSSVTLKGEDQGRVNILLAGDSADDPGHTGGNLTDSIMIASIDTRNHSGFLLSVPRDLWVNLPGMGHQKINAANDMTKFSAPGYPAGGMGQLEEIVQTDLGIPIDYYALIDYTAFKQAVDAVGGIPITIQSSDPRGIYDAFTHLKLANGPMTLSGEEALNLARARGDNAAGDVSYGLGSDFDRTQHQRDMLKALAQKAASVGVLTNPLKVTQLFDAFGNNVQTDINLADIRQFIQITQGLNLTSLQSATYSYTGPNALLKNYIDPTTGEEALAPAAGIDNFGQLQQYYQQLTANSPVAKVAKEAPTAVILNGSDVVGLAHKEAQDLEAKGFAVMTVSDAHTEYASTMIVDATQGQKMASLRLVQQMFPGTTTATKTSSTEAAEAQAFTADFVVVLGQNWDTAAATAH